MACQDVPGVLRGVLVGQSGVEVPPRLVEAFESPSVGACPRGRQPRPADGADHSFAGHQPARAELPRRGWGDFEELDPGEHPGAAAVHFPSYVRRTGGHEVPG